MSRLTDTALGRLSLTRATLRLLAAAGLGYDAYAHLHLASGYAANRAALSQADLFRIEAAAAILAAIAVLALRSRLGDLVALLVAAAGLLAVLLYRYLDVGPILGFLPNMYEPTWFPEKTISAIAEAAATLATFTLLTIRRKTRTKD